MNTFRLFGLVALIVSLAACAEGFGPPPPGTGGGNGTGATGATGATGGRGATGGSGATGGNAATGGSGGSSGMGGGAGTGGVGGMSGAGGTGGVGGMSPDACTTDAMDTEVIQMTAPNLRYWAARCATVNCLNLITVREMFIECVAGCVEQNATPSDQLSSECGDCYGELAWCAGIDCNFLCSSNQSAICSNVACIGGATGSMTCNAYGACLADLNHCAGRDSLDCPD